MSAREPAAAAGTVAQEDPGGGVVAANWRDLEVVALEPARATGADEEAVTPACVGTGRANMIEGLKHLGKTVFLTTHYMDEAQHLADRVAILAEGRIVARGRPDELGTDEQRTAVIRFRLPDGVTAEQMGSEAGAPAEASGDEVTLRTADPQPALLRLLTWAQRSGVALEALSVQRPTLEDIFLALTRASEEGST